MRRSTGICHTAEETLESFNQETFDEGSANSHCFKWGTFPPNEVCRISQQSVREKEEKKESLAIILSGVVESLLAHRARVPSLNPGPVKNFFSFESKIFINIVLRVCYIC